MFLESKLLSKIPIFFLKEYTVDESTLFPLQRA